MYDCTDIAEKHGISITITLTMNNNPKFELVLKLMRFLDVVVSSDICNFKHRKKTEHEFHKSRLYYIAIHTAECYKSHHEIFCIASIYTERCYLVGESIQLHTMAISYISVRSK